MLYVLVFLHNKLLTQTCDTRNAMALQQLMREQFMRDFGIPWEHNLSNISIELRTIIFGSSKPRIPTNF
jgi:hypothetical protein